MDYEKDIPQEYTGECPGCYFEIYTKDKVILGEVISCPDCAVDLEVIKIKGNFLRYQIAETTDEDWGE